MSNKRHTVSMKKQYEYRIDMRAFTGVVEAENEKEATELLLGLLTNALNGSKKVKKNAYVWVGDKVTHDPDE